MNQPHKQSVTLLELLIAISLLGILVLAFTSIDLFSRYHVLTADRRAQVQNEASSAIEHMTKYISQGIGDINNPAAIPTTIGVDTAIIVWLDGNPYSALPVAPNGRRDTTSSNDHRIAYRFTGLLGANPYQIRYCPNCTNLPCTMCAPAWGNEIIAHRIAPAGANPAFSIVYDNTTTDGDPIDNYLEVIITACHDPDGAPNACGTPDNPSVTMRTQIKMPAVSTN